MGLGFVCIRDGQYCNMTGTGAAAAGRRTTGATSHHKVRLWSIRPLGIGATAAMPSAAFEQDCTDATPPAVEEPDPRPKESDR